MPLGRAIQKADGKGSFLQEATCPQHPLRRNPGCFAGQGDNTARRSQQLALGSTAQREQDKGRADKAAQATSRVRSDRWTGRQLDVQSAGAGPASSHDSDASLHRQRLIFWVWGGVFLAIGFFTPHPHPTSYFLFIFLFLESIKKNLRLLKKSFPFRGWTRFY